MAIIWAEAGGDATYNTGLWTGSNLGISGTTPTVDTTVSATGPCSLLFAPGVSGSNCALYKSNILADAGRRISLRIRLSALPTSTAAEFCSLETSSPTIVTGLRIRSDGKLQLGSNTSTIGSTVLATNTFNRVTLAYTITSTTVNSFRVYLNGGLEISLNNVSLPVTGTSHLFCGWTNPSASPIASENLWIDDVYVDDSSALTDPGDVRCTAKLPSALSTNTFGSSVGSFTNRWDLVSQRPASNASYWNSTASPQSEIYGIQTASAGDADLSSATILGFMGWIWALIPNAAPNTKITVNGTDYSAATSLSGVDNYQSQVVASSVYPSNGAAIGVKYTDATGTFPKLYECGVVVAYTAVAGPPAVPSGLTASPGNTQISLSWSASSGATTYNIKRSTTSGSGYATVASGISTTSVTDTGLTNGTTYYYVVSAVNVSGESANSTQASATPIAAPSAPTGVTASPGNAQVSLAWSAVSGASTYNVKRSTTSGSGYATVATVSLTSATDTGLTNNTAYYYVITAVNAGGSESGNSSQVSATPIVPPSVVWMESGGDATYDFQFWNTTTGSPAVDTTISNTGPASLKFDSTVSNTQVNTSRTLAADTGRRISFYTRFSSLPTSAADFFTVKTSGFVYILGVRLRSDGKLQLGGDATAIGTTVLSATTQNRVCFSYTISSTTVNSFRVYLNGNLEISKDNVSLPATASVNMSWGWPNSGALPGASKIVWIDDIFVDDSNSLTDTGDVRITAKQPNALSTNTFSFAFGNSYANRWQYVSERPRSNSSGLQSSGSPQTEVFAIQDASTGDVNISGAAYKGYMGWVTALYTGTLPTTYFTINGIDTLFSLNTGSTTFSRPSTSASYPSNGAGIGIKQTAGTGSVQFFEGGILVAFSGGTTQTVNLLSSTVAAGSQSAIPSRAITRSITNQSRSLVAQSMAGQSTLTRSVSNQSRSLVSQTATRQAVYTRTLSAQSRSLVARTMAGQSPLTKTVSTQTRTLAVASPTLQHFSTVFLGASTRPLTASAPTLQAGGATRNVSTQIRNLMVQAITKQSGATTAHPSARILTITPRTPVPSAGALTVVVLRDVLTLAAQTANQSGLATTRSVSFSILTGMGHSLVAQVGGISKSLTFQSRSLTAPVIVPQARSSQNVSVESLTVGVPSAGGTHGNVKDLSGQILTLLGIDSNASLTNLARLSRALGTLVARVLTPQKGVSTAQPPAASRSLANRTPTFQTGRITKTLLSQSRTLSAVSETVLRGGVTRAPSAQIRSVFAQTAKWGMGVHISAVTTISQARGVGLVFFRRMDLAPCFIQEISFRPTVTRTVPYILTGVTVQTSGRTVTPVPGGVTKTFLPQIRPIAAALALSHPASRSSVAFVTLGGSAQIPSLVPGVTLGRPAAAAVLSSAPSPMGTGGAVSWSLDFQVVGAGTPEALIAYPNNFVPVGSTAGGVSLGTVQVIGHLFLALSLPAQESATTSPAAWHFTYRLGSQLLVAVPSPPQITPTNVESHVGLRLIALLPPLTLSFFGHFHANVSDRPYALILPMGGGVEGVVFDVPRPKGEVTS